MSVILCFISVNVITDLFNFYLDTYAAIMIIVIMSRDQTNHLLLKWSERRACDHRSNLCRPLFQVFSFFFILAPLFNTPEGVVVGFQTFARAPNSQKYQGSNQTDMCANFFLLSRAERCRYAVRRTLELTKQIRVISAYKHISSIIKSMGTFLSFIYHLPKYFGRNPTS